MLPNRDQYEGEYRHGFRNGNGRYWWSKSNASYTGDWKKGLQDGTGKFNYPDGSSYYGAWRKGKKHGYGKYVYQNGDIFEGTWKENQKHGVGTYLSQESNITYKATWVNGLVKGPVQICYPNYQYHGYWNVGEPIGNGVFTFGTKYMLPGHIEMFKNQDFVESTHELDLEDEGGAPEALKDNNEGVVLNPSQILNGPRCLPYFVGHEIIPFEFAKLPQHPIPAPDTDSEESVCTKSSTSSIHLYQVQSPVLIAAESVETENDFGGEFDNGMGEGDE